MALRGFFTSFRLAAILPIAAALPTAAFLLWSLLPGLLEDSAAANLADALPLLTRGIAQEVGREPVELQTSIRELARDSDLRVTVIRRDGVVVADSARTWEGVALMDNHATRPEIEDTLLRGRGRSVRRSATTGLDYVYVARTFTGPSGELFVLRLARPLRAVASLRGTLARILWLAAGLALGAVIVVWWWLERRLYRPLEELVVGAETLARGAYDERLGEPDAAELAALAAALNRLAAGVEEQIGRVEAERNQLRTVLASMSDGVMVTDRESRVRLVNPAFERLFEVTGDVNGRSVLDVTREPAVEHLVERTLEAGGEGAPETRDFQAQSNRTVSLRAVPFAGSGVLVVAQDVTERIRLDDTRRDFVANVSHELRTPLTAIRGFAETLYDGALEEAEAGQRFVTRILDQSARLETLLADLLSLSKLESQGYAAAENRTALDIGGLVRRALETVAPAAAERGIELDVHTEDDLVIECYLEALERMVVNLADNAIKYNHPGGWVRVRAVRTHGEVLLEVSDSGIGMPAQAVDRVFERFYRVDKGRSRKEGGTGLGLAIVKHAAQLHGGRVEVESRVGEGSTFRAFLPA